MNSNEIWILYNLEKYYFENDIDLGQPARVEPDFFLQGFEDMWEKDKARKEDGTLLDDEIV